MMRQAAFLSFLVSLSSVLAESPSVTVERLAPQAYAANSADFAYYKKATLTRDAPDTYSIAASFQGELPATAPVDTGIKYIVSADIDDKAGRMNPGQTGWVGSSRPLEITLLQNPASGKMYVIPSEFEERKKIWPVTISKFTHDEKGFSFTVQSPFFAENVKTRFSLSSEVLKRSVVEGRLSSINEKPSGQHPLLLDLDKLPAAPGADQEPPPPAGSQESPERGGLGQITFDKNKLVDPLAPGRPSKNISRTRPAEDPEIPDYLCFGKVAVARSENSLTLDVALAEPLPSALPKDLGFEYAFNFDFGEKVYETNSNPKKGPKIQSGGNAFVIVQFVPATNRFQAKPGLLERGNKNSEIKVATFVPSKTGFTVTFTSPVFAQDGPISIRSSGRELYLSTFNGKDPLVEEGRTGPITSSVQAPAVSHTGFGLVLHP